MAILTTCSLTFIDLNEIHIGDAPANPMNNELWFDTTNNILKKYNSKSKIWEVVNDYTQDIIDALEGLQVSSRNLLASTSYESQIVCTNTSNKTGAEFAFVRTIDYVKNIKDKEITMAFDWELVTSTTPSGTFRVQTTGTQVVQIGDITTISNSNYYGTCAFTATLTAASGITGIHFRTDGVTGTFKITHPRLFYGSKDLGWTQAPEDLTAQFETIINKQADGVYISVADKDNDVKSLVSFDSKKVVIDSANIDLKGYVTITSLSDPSSTTTIDGNLIETDTLSANKIKTGKIQGKNSNSYFNLDNGTFSLANATQSLMTFNGTSLTFQNNVNYNLDKDDFSSNLGWIKNWTEGSTTINSKQVLSPMAFFGTVNTSKQATGISLGGSLNEIYKTEGIYNNVDDGIAGYKLGTKTFHLKTDGTLMIGPNTTGNYLSWDGSNLNVRASSLNIGSEVVATTGNVNDAVSNIQIGGRNLFLNSKNILLNGSDNGNNSCSIIENDYVKISPKNNGNVYNIGISTSETKTQNKIYTISFEVLTPTTIGFYWYPSETYSKTNYISGSSVWQKVSFTYTQSGADRKGNSLFGLSGLIGGNIYCYKNLKLEYGTKSTDWTPAIEDVDASINSVSTSLGALDSSVKSAFGDGIINDSEAKALASNIQILTNEKSDIDKEYATIYANSNLTSSTAKTNLNVAKTAYNSAHSSLISSINTVIADKIITVDERNSVESFFTTYRTKIADYKQRLQEALDYISTKKVDDIQIGGRNLAKKGCISRYSTNTNTTVIDTNFVKDGSATFSRTAAINEGPILDRYTVYEPGEEYVISFKLKTVSGTVNSIHIYNGCSHSDTSVYIDNVYKDTFVKDILFPSDNNFHNIELKFKAGSVDRGDGSSANTLNTILQPMKTSSTVYTMEILNFKIELGNKPSDWTPAPEDIDTAITDVDNKVISTTNRVSTIETDLNSITLRVGTAESTLTTTTTELGKVDGKISDAKSSAINTASSDATTKANSAKTAAINAAASDATSKANAAQTAAISTASSDATSKANSALASAKGYTDGQVKTVNESITKTEAAIKLTTDAIDLRVGKTETNITTITTTTDMLKTGLNKWLLEVFGRGSVTGTSVITIADLVGKNVTKTMLIDDPPGYINIGDTYLARATTNVYLDADYSWTINARSDDGGTLYLNGQVISSTGTTIKSVTLPFKQGWNKITWVYNENTGDDGFYFSTKVSTLSQIKIMTAYDQTNINEEVMIVSDTLSTTKNQVASIQTDLSSITSRVSSTESTITSHTTDLGKVDTKISDAKTAAINAAASDATSKANSAKSSAVSTAASDATSKANAAQTAAISTASSDATSKANSALASAKSYTDGQVTTVNETITKKVADIKLTTDSITSRVESTESNISTITNITNNLTSPAAMPYQKDLIIYGESNKYYPVYIKGGNQDILRTIKIWRNYSEQAPSDWYSATHKGSLMLTWQGNFGAWGGADYKECILENSSQYTVLLADCTRSVHSMGYTFFLRGGGTVGAIYHFASDQSVNPQVYYNGSSDLVYDNANDVYKVYAYTPKTTIETEKLNNLKIARESSISTIKNQVSEIVSDLSGITSRVSTAESNISTTNGNVTSLTERVRTAEQKITDDSIVATVTKSQTNGTNTFIQQSDITQLDQSWTAKFNDGYNQGITTINKDGITVTSSGVKSKTSMSSSGFKITKTDTSEDVFKVNADGTLTIKGNITVTGGSVPVANLDGKLSSTQLDSTITTDISTAKSNASTALSTANSANSAASTASSNASTALSTANSANTTAGTAKSTADAAKSTATTASTNASTALTAANSAKSTADLLAQGLNKWMLIGYDITGAGYNTATVPTFNLLANKDVKFIKEILDSSTSSGMGLGDNYIGHAKTNIYLDSAYSYTGTLTTDDAGAIYLNGSLVTTTVTCVAKSITLNLKAGWNTVEVLFTEISGGDGFVFSPKFNTITQIKRMNAYEISSANIASNLVSESKNILDTNKTNWVNAYNRVNEWASGAVTGSTTINGGLIETNTITAKHIAIGDFTNYCIVDSNYTMNNGNFSYKITDGSMQHANISSKLTQLNGNEKFKATGSIYGSSTNTGTTNFNIAFIWRDSGGTALDNSSIVTLSVSTNSTTSLNEQITIPSRPANATYGAFKVWVSDVAQTLYWYNPSIRLMQTGELIVDGTITTNHISTVGLNADVIKAGTISADRIDANTIVSKVNGATTTVSGNKIRTGLISANSGGSYLNLDNGSMMLGTTSLTSYLQWTGSALNIKASSLSISGVSAATTTDVSSAKTQAINEASGVKDTRSTNQSPDWYIANYPQRTVQEFKTLSALGLTGGGTYGTLETKIPWANSSGGYPIQTFFGDEAHIFTRKGISGTAWSEWVRKANATQSDVFNALTNNGTAQGIYLNDGKVYLNASMIKTGTLDADCITTETLTGKTLSAGTISGGSININNAFKVDSTGKLIATGAEITGKVTISAGSTVPTSTLSGTVSSSQLHSSITTSISDAATSATNANNKIDNLQIGGRNLFKGYKEEEITLKNYQSTGGFTQFTNNLTFNPADYIGKEFTISFYAKSPNGTTPLNLYNSNGNPRYFYFNTTLDTALGTSWKYYSYTFTNTDRGSTFSISNKIEIYASSKMGVLVKKIKLELGNKATDYTVAPEDVDTAISDVDAKVIATTNRVSTIETDLSAITLRVGTTESTIFSHTTDLGKVDTKISDAKTAAINSASADATTKANSAKTAAISSAASDATTKANTAKTDAISAAATDATSKANAAQTNATSAAKSYTDAQVKVVNETITTKEAAIKLTTDSITSRVASTETNITTIDGNITSLTTRMSSAESKITDDAIISTVSSTIAESEKALNENIDSSVGTARNELLANIAENYATNDAFNSLSTTVYSQFEQTASDITATFNNAISYAQEVDGNLQNYQDSVSTFIRFSADGIDLGKTTSPFATRLDNTKLSFSQDGNEVAYISNNKMNITTADIKDELRIGTSSSGFFIWSQGGNGNLTLKWSDS